MSARNILVFCRSFPSLYGGVLEVQNRIKLMVSLGFHVTVITAKKPGISSFEDGLYDEKLSIISLPDFFNRAFVKLINPLQLVNLYMTNRYMLKLVCEKRPCAIMVHGERPYSIFLKMQHIVPLFFFRHDAMLTCPSMTRFLKKSRSICHKRVGLSCLLIDRKEFCMKGISIFKKISRILLRKHDIKSINKFRHFIVNSHYIRTLHRVDAFVQYPTVDVAIEETLSNEKRDAYRILFVGRFEALKGPGEALKILSGMPEKFTLMMIGDGMLRSELEVLVKKFGIEHRVTFTGWIEQGKVHSLMRTSGATIIPSLCGEAFSMVGIESLLSGTPVVAYDVGGVSEWCIKPFGVTVPCGDVQLAGDSLQEICNNPYTWDTLSEKSKEYVEKKFGFEVFRNHLVDFLKQYTDCEIKVSQ